MSRHFLAITDFSREEILEVFQLSGELKEKQKRGEAHRYLEGKTLAMIFQKPSARTRVSFEVGMFQLGGHALYLSPNDIQMGKRESIPDVARTLSRFVDVIMARVFGHNEIEQLAEYASVPVINGLSDLLHPCQVMADVFTILEKRGSLENLKVAFVGDGNNVANSWINIASRIAMQLHLAIPEGYDPNPDILHKAQAAGLSEIKIFRNPVEAVKGVDVIYTDVWASMGQEAEAEKRRADFKEYQVNIELTKHAASDHLVMHCLPAHRGEEITDEVIDGPHSVVFDEAENRLHVQKAIMVKLLTK
ncbi:MAG: ornithine carbamoyltransferase [Calditrichaeota bacterium]|nr:MAG: ornithine carbamoyltransferase [Calditrichota bacterium]